MEKNKTLPIWIVELYNSKNETDWEFDGEGIVLINEITKDVIVLEAGKHLEINNPKSKQRNMVKLILKFRKM